MVSDTSTPTREELETTLAQRLNEAQTAEKAHAAAVKAFEKAVGQVGTQELLALGEAAQNAKTAVDLKQKLAKKAKESVDGYEMIAKQGERNELISGEVQAMRDGEIVTCEHGHDVVVPGLDFGHYAAVGIEEITFTCNTTERTISAKPRGPGIRAASAGRPKTTGSNGGFTSRGAIRFEDGREFPSVNRAYMDLRTAADGTAPAPANSESATRWLTKNVGSFTYTNQ